MHASADAVIPLPPRSLRLRGRLGRALDRCIEHRLKTVDYRHLADPFRNRDEVDGRWRCEFWGKVVRSAILAWRGTGDAALLERIEAAVADILTTQDAAGCISSYPADRQTADWDIWGRKYVLLGLSRFHSEVRASPAVVAAMGRMLDHLMTQVGPGARAITACGWHGGLAASSLLDPVARLAAITGDPRHLAYARWIAAHGGTTDASGDIFAAARSGVRPAAIGNGKAYEMMSCFEGLAQLHRLTGDPLQREAVVALHRLVRDQEIFITGVGGLKDEWGEYWHDGALNQVRSDRGMLGETCVTTTWLKLCSEVLRLTGDATVADDMERSLLNGTLGAMTPDGSWWMHVNPTPLAGPSSRKPSGEQFPGFGDCCVANGPEGLALAPWLAVLGGPSGPMVALYEDLDAEVPLPSGGTMRLSVAADLPRSPRAVITVDSEVEAALSLRIPLWSERTVLRVGDEVLPAPAPGSWAVVSRRWRRGDRVAVELDLHPRFQRAAGDPGRVAMQIGPYVLAQDARLGPVDAPVAVGAGAQGRLAMRVVPSPDPLIDTVVELADGTRLCDYASAGNRFDPADTMCVWLPTALGRLRENAAC